MSNPSDPKAVGKWSCTTCTLENPAHRRKCEICLAPRPNPMQHAHDDDEHRPAQDSHSIVEIRTRNAEQSSNKDAVEIRALQTDRAQRNDEAENIELGSAVARQSGQSQVYQHEQQPRTCCFVAALVCKYFIVSVCGCGGIAALLACVAYWRGLIRISFDWFLVLAIYGALVIFAVLLLFCDVRRNRDVSDNSPAAVELQAGNSNARRMRERKSEYLDKLSAFMRNNSIDKHRMIKLLDKYKHELENHVVRVMSGILHRYELQTSVAAYYDIVILLCGLVPSNAEHCDHDAWTVTHWSCLGIFFTLGCIAQLQSLYNSTTTPCQNVSVFISNASLLFVMLMAIDLRPLDCYFSESEFLLQSSVFCLGVFMTVADAVLHCKFDADSLFEDTYTDVRAILEEMKQTSSNQQLFETELSVIKSSIQNIHNEKERDVPYYFHIFYFYLHTNFGAVIGLAGYYAMITFVINLSIIFINDHSSFAVLLLTELIIRWSMFGLFALTLLAMSIRNTLFDGLSLCQRFTWWLKKCVWSVLVGLSLMVAMEAQPISDYMDAIFLRYVTAICLCLGIVGHLYFPLLFSLILSSGVQQRGGGDDAVDDVVEDVVDDHEKPYGHFAVEFPQHEDIELEPYEEVPPQASKKEVTLVTPQKANEDVDGLPTIKTLTTTSRLRPEPKHVEMTETKHQVASVMVHQQKIDSNGNIRKQLKLQMTDANIRQCNDCFIERQGHADMYGTFYCDECWSRNPNDPDAP